MTTTPTVVPAAKTRRRRMSPSFPEEFSNFFASPITYDGIAYPTVEHAFQAQKTLDLSERRRIAHLTKPRDAKRAGRHVALRSDWDQVKGRVMLDLLRLKFAPGTALAGQLLAHSGEIVELNRWHDVIWGRCTCPLHDGAGENRQGRLLMQVRDELAGVTSPEPPQAPTQFGSSPGSQALDWPEAYRRITRFQFEARDLSTAGDVSRFLLELGRWELADEFRSWQATQRELLDRAEEAWAFLDQQVRRWAWRALGDECPQQVDDSVADTRASVLVGLANAYGPESFRGFVLGHFLNAKKRAWRECHRAARPSSSEDDDESGPDEIVEILDLQTCLANLPGRDRRVLELRYFARASSSEIAAAVGVASSDYAKKLVFLALARLRQCTSPEQQRHAWQEARVEGRRLDGRQAHDVAHPDWPKLWAASRPVRRDPVGLDRLGEYAALGRHGGEVAARRTLPEVSEHLATGCDPCDQELSQIDRMLEEEEAEQ